MKIVTILWLSLLQGLYATDGFCQPISVCGSDNREPVELDYDDVGPVRFKVPIDFLKPNEMVVDFEQGFRDSIKIYIGKQSILNRYIDSSIDTIPRFFIFRYPKRGYRVLRIVRANGKGCVEFPLDLRYKSMRASVRRDSANDEYVSVWYVSFTNVGDIEKLGFYERLGPITYDE